MYLKIYCIKKKGKVIQFYAHQFNRIRDGLIPSDEKVVCTAFNLTKRLRTGDMIVGYGRVTPIVSDENPGAFNAVNYYRAKGIHQQCLLTDHLLILGNYPTWRNKVEHFREKLSAIFDKQLSVRESGLAKALLLGDASAVDATGKATFSATGAIHLLAVSGMHVSLLAQVLVLFFSLFHRIVKRNLSQLLCIGLLGYFAVLTGLSPSVVRSVLMFSLLQMAQLFGEKNNNNHSLLLCAFLMLVFDPPCLFDIGFQLSFLAVFGIYNFQKPLETLIKPNRKIPRFLWSNLCISIAAQALTLPLTLYYFHSFPNYFLLASIGLAFLSSVVMYLGFLYLFVCSIPYLSHMIAVPFQISLKTLCQFLETVASIPGAKAEGYELTPLMSLLLALSIVVLLSSKFFNKMRVVPISLMIVLITVGRYRRQTEHHLHLLSGKTSFAIYKRGSQATIIIPQNSSCKTTRFLCYNYGKVYPFKRLDTLYVNEGDSLIFDQFALQQKNHCLLFSRTVSGKPNTVDTLICRGRTSNRTRKIQFD